MFWEVWVADHPGAAPGPVIPPPFCFFVTTPRAAAGRRGVGVSGRQGYTRSTKSPVRVSIFTRLPISM
jgi:hypothetical protein